MTFCKKLIPLLVALSCAPAARADYSSFTVFGDSLSDAGTFGASFTTNPDPVWSRTVGTALGFPASPAQLSPNLGGIFAANGGNVWAQGGARVAATPGVGVTQAQPVTTQLATYLASTGGTASSSGLYAVWAGANDVFFQVATAPTPLAVQANVATAAQTLGASLAQLQASGARNIVVFSLPDLGKTPAALAQGPAAAGSLSGLTALYNGALTSTLGALGVHALVLDAKGLFDEVIANPALFGFTVGNTAVACAGPSSLACSPATLNAPNAGQTYLFADGVHPTGAGHQIIADYFLSVVRAPAFAGMAAAHLGQAAELQWVATDSRQQRFLNGALPEGKGDFYGQLLAGNIGVDGSAGASADTRSLSPSLTIGLDRNLGDGTLIGAAVSLVADRFDIKSAENGKVSGQSVGVTLYGSQRFGRAYVSAAGLLTSSNYKLDREFTLGRTQRTESGETNGTVKALRLEGGYDLAQGTLRHGPFAGLTYRHISLDAYGERSGRATAMRFGEQSFNQVRPALGYQASWQVDSGLRLSGRASYEKELKDSQHDVSVGLVNTYGELTDTVGSAKKPDFVRLVAQADWALTPTSSFSLVAGGNFGNGAKQGAVSASYALRF